MKLNESAARDHEEDITQFNFMPRLNNVVVVIVNIDFRAFHSKT